MMTESFEQDTAALVEHNGVGISAGGLTPLPGADLEAVARKALAKLG